MEMEDGHKASLNGEMELCAVRKCYMKTGGADKRGEGPFAPLRDHPSIAINWGSTTSGFLGSLGI